MKKWTQKDKRKIMKGFKTINKELRIWPCQVYYKFYDSTPEKDDMENVASVSYSFPYDKVNLDCYLGLLDMNDSELSFALWHEAFHVLLDPMTKNRLKADEIYTDYEEQAVERLSHCLGWNVFRE